MLRQRLNKRKFKTELKTVEIVTEDIFSFAQCFCSNEIHDCVGKASSTAVN